MSWHSWAPYVPVAERRARAARELAKQVKAGGPAPSPVRLTGRKIADTFWGKAWCDNLERYSDYSNRLPRGRTYVRNGSVVDLQVKPGEIHARVSGSSLYRIQIQIEPLSAARWDGVQADCAGKIDSVLELLQGRLSGAVMEIVTRPERGLFPSPKQIKMKCSCPDWAGLCKHLAAVLYGIGARLDQQPELLFELRGVNPAELISRASITEAVRPASPTAAPAMSEADLADVFGIELAAGQPVPVAEQSAPTAVLPSGTVGKPAGKTPKVSKLKAGLRKPASRQKPAAPRPLKKGKAQKTKRKISPAGRKLIMAAQKARWARLKKMSTKH